MKTIFTFIFTLLIQQFFSQSKITFDAYTEISVQSGADICADSIIINGAFNGSGTICQGPLPVELVSFSYSVKTRNVILKWETAFELNNSGFLVERLKISFSGTEAWQNIGFVNGRGTVNNSSVYFFNDEKLNTGKYKYRLKQTDYSGSYEYYSLNEAVTIDPPSDFSISQNYPNPSNPKSQIDYEIPVSGIVTIKLYNILGQEVLILMNEKKDAGYYTVQFDGTNLSSGVYFYTIDAGEFKLSKKMVLVK